MTKIFKKMIANDSNPYLGYMNKLVDEYNNVCHHSIDKRPIDADFLLCLKKLNRIIKLLKKITIFTRILYNCILYYCCFSYGKFEKTFVCY